MYGSCYNTRTAQQIHNFLSRPHIPKLHSLLYLNEHVPAIPWIILLQHHGNHFCCNTTENIVVEIIAQYHGKKYCCNIMENVAATS